jgi:hypothetical protein
MISRLVLAGVLGFLLSTLIIFMLFTYVIHTHSVIQATVIGGIVGLLSMVAALVLVNLTE